MATMTGICGKCDGKGRLNGFSHIANGVCFTCEGTGIMTVKAAPDGTESARRDCKTVVLESLNLSAFIIACAFDLKVDLNFTDREGNDAICGTVWIDKFAARKGIVKVTASSDGVVARKLERKVAAALQEKIKVAA